MNPEPLLDAAGLVADGTPFDLRDLSSGLSSDRERDLADELAVVARIAEAHRQLHVLLSPGTLPAEPTVHAASWGHLELIEVVGRGSYGTVYRAWDPRLDRHVALKLFPNAQNPEAVMREGRMLARIRHENVVTVYGADVFDGVAGIWMEFVRGRSLDRIVETQGAMSASEATQIGIDVARALAAVHGAGFVHCDVKAQNVIRESGGRIVLMDMGAGRSAAPTDSTLRLQVAGTPRYMAPELFGSVRALPSSDVYSVGVLLYYLVSRRFPVDGKTLSDIRMAHLEGRREHLRDVRPDLPSGFLREVTRALDPLPAQRQKTAGELEAGLLGIASPEGSALRIPRRLRVAAAVVATLLAVAAAIGVFKPLPKPSALHSIAVLPIRNLTGDPSKGYIADGLTEVLISNLARIRVLSVPSFAAVSGFRDQTQPSRAVADKLGVKLLLAGSIVAVGQRSRIVVHLVNPATDTVVWGDELTRESSELLSAQGEIARLVAAYLALQLSPAEQRGLTQKAIDPVAQDEYLKGLAILTSSPATSDLRSARLAAEHFRRAVELVPAFAAGWAELARVKVRLIDLEFGVDRVNRAAEVKELALRAIEIDPGLSVGYLALGTTQFYHDWDFPAAEHTLRSALEWDPSSAVMRSRLAVLLATQSRHDEAIRLGREARDLEPMVPIHSTSLGILYYYARDFSNAEREMQRALDIVPGYLGAHFGLGRIYSAVGRHADALAQFQTSLLPSRPPAYLVELARAQTAAGQAAAAQRILEELEERKRNGEGYSSDNLAYIAAAAGRIDEAFAILGRAVDERLTNVLWLAVDPRADPLRQDPRFTPLLTRIGLRP